MSHYIQEDNNENTPFFSSEKQKRSYVNETTSLENRKKNYQSRILYPEKNIIQK